jgi:hypothetical protein
MFSREPDLGERIFAEIAKQKGRKYLIWNFFVLRVGLPSALVVALVQSTRSGTSGSLGRDILRYVLYAALNCVLAVPVFYLIGRRFYTKVSKLN